MAKQTEEQRVDAEIAAKIIELTAIHRVEIFPLKFVDQQNEGKFVVGYMKDPPRISKLRVMDKIAGAMYSTGAELVEVSLIKEASDPRIWSEAPENDDYFIGACTMVNKIVTFSLNLFKKK